MLRRRRIASRAKPSGARINRPLVPYDPYVALAAKLVLAVDWRRDDLVSVSSSPALASSVLDVIAAHDFAQASGSLQPGYEPPGGLTFDGLDDFLNLPSTPMPTGANPFYFAAIVDQQALAANTTVRTIASWGSTTDSTRALLQRVVSGGVNRAFLRVGTGSGSVTLTFAGVDFSGVHVVEAWGDGTNIYLCVDGGTPVTAACVPGIGTTRTRLGSSTATLGANFWQGEVFLGHWLNALPTTEERTEYLAHLITLAATV